VLCRGKSLPADPGMAVRGDDEIGTGSDFGSRDQFGIGLHHDLDRGRAGSRGEAIFAVSHDHSGDVDLVLPEHVQSCHAEVAGADEGDPHGLPSVIGRFPPVDKMGRFPPVDNMPQRLGGLDGQGLSSVINRGTTIVVRRWRPIPNYQKPHEFKGVRP
jgi:hypothetical protein